MMQTFRLAAAMLAAAIALPAAAAASQGTAGYPQRPIRILVPFAAGGVTDALLRMLQEPVAERLGQPVTIENRPGAAGAIAARAAATAAPDGYTFLVVNTGLLAITPFMQEDAGFDPLRSFDAVAGLTSAPSVLLTHPSVPADSVRAFIEHARANPDQLEYAVVGRGAYGDLATADFARRAGIRMISVPYQGNAQTTLALLSGEVKVQLTILSDAMNAYIREGRLKALGVAAPAPTPLVPGVPPIAEVLPGFEALVHTGLVAPTGTPAAAVQMVGEAFTEALGQAAIRNRLLAMGMESAPLAAGAYARRIEAEIARFAPVIQAVGAR